MSTKTEPLKEHRKRRRLHREGGEEGSGEGRTRRGGGGEGEIIECRCARACVYLTSK